jgi:PAS domain S-box-containing protein
VGALAAIYFGAARFGLSLAFAHRNVSLVWPPTGIALAALVVFGRRLWPGVAAGAFLINASTGVSLPVALAIAAGNTLEALLGAYLVHRAVGFRCSLERLRDVFALVGLAGILATTVSATIGVTSLCVGGAAAWSSYGSLWWQWWLGDAMGDLVVAPVLLTWAAPPPIPWQLGRRVEAGALLAVLSLVGYVVLGRSSSAAANVHPLAFAVFPFVIWAALRLGPRGAATATFVVSSLAISGVSRDVGPFVGTTPTQALLVLQVYMGVLVTTALVLAAVTIQRAKAEGEHARLAFIVASSDDAIIGTTLDGEIRSWNAGAERLYGYRAEEIMGRSIALIMPPDQPNELPRILDRLRRGERIEHYEAVRRRKDGTRVDVSVTISPVRDSRGNVIGASAIARDISHRKRLEAAAREAETLRAVTSLAVAAAHEINNPLTVVRGSLELLATELRDSHALQRIDLALAEADRIHMIVQRMSHITQLQFVDQPHHLPEMLDLRRASGDPEEPQAPPS